MLTINRMIAKTHKNSTAKATLCWNVRTRGSKAARPGLARSSENAGAVGCKSIAPCIRRANRVDLDLPCVGQTQWRQLSGILANPHRSCQARDLLKAPPQVWRFASLEAN